MDLDNYYNVIINFSSFRIYFKRKKNMDSDLDLWTNKSYEFGYHVFGYDGCKSKQKEWIIIWT